jgi:hypothetical protein
MEVMGWSFKPIPSFDSIFLGDFISIPALQLHPTNISTPHTIVNIHYCIRNIGNFMILLWLKLFKCIKEVISFSNMVYYMVTCIRKIFLCT